MSLFDREFLVSASLGALVGGAIGSAVSKKKNTVWFALAGAAASGIFVKSGTRNASPKHFTGAGEMSFEDAWAHATQSYDPSGTHPPDLTADQLARPFAGGGFLNTCGMPETMSAIIKAAVQNGRAVGVTVTTSPPSQRISACIASAVRRMQFPSNPNMDAVTQTF